jgi:ATP-dependent DNA helicase RecQ
MGGGDSSSNFLSRIAAGEIKYILTQPETALNERVLPMLCSMKSICHLIVDEAHLVIKWGGDFRPKFGELGRLRAEMKKCLPNLKTAALTGTANYDTVNKVKLSLRLTECDQISCSSDRPNIKLSVMDRLSSSGNYLNITI